MASGGFLTRRRCVEERRPLLGEHHLAVDAVSAGERGFKGGAWRHCGRLQESEGRERGISLRLWEIVFARHCPLSYVVINRCSTPFITPDLYCITHSIEQNTIREPTFLTPVALLHTHSATPQNYIPRLFMYLTLPLIITIAYSRLQSTTELRIATCR